MQYGIALTLAIAPMMIRAPWRQYMYCTYLYALYYLYVTIRSAYTLGITAMPCRSRRDANRVNETLTYRLSLSRFSLPCAHDA